MTAPIISRGYQFANMTGIYRGFIVPSDADHNSTTATGHNPYFSMQLQSAPLKELPSLSFVYGLYSSQRTKKLHTVPVQVIIELLKLI